MEELTMIHLPKREPFSYQEITTAEDYRPKYIHMHDTHEINFITSPSLCKVQCNGSLCVVQAPAIILQTRGTYHALLSASGPFESRVIYFDPNAARGFGEALFQKSRLFSSDFTALSLSPEEVSRFIPLFDLVQKEEQEEGILLILAILSKLDRLRKNNTPHTSLHTKNTYIFPLIRFIQDHLAEKLTVEVLANTFHVSPTKLKTDFRSITDRPIKTFITDARLNLAKSLLQDPAVPLSQIALSCGFSGESHLIRAFRSAFGITPGAWRQRTRNENHPE